MTVQTAAKREEDFPPEMHNWELRLRNILESVQFCYKYERLSALDIHSIFN